MESGGTAPFLEIKWLMLTNRGRTDGA